ncbi:MAG: phosphate signaling complex protein PhoU [Candidatus Omnitrophica bacterium]|nr:phosphate signaling complex protein PhoU [Candidatus Omnitrophota bacterium]
MERHFDEELKRLKEKLLQMADLSQEMIGLAVRSLVRRQTSFAEETLTVEETVNRLEIEIEEEVIRLIARMQPAAKDLRLLTATLKITNDLERVADQACNIAETALRLLKEPPLKPLVDVPNMAALSQRMIKNSLDAFVNHDPALAKKVCEDDDQVDRLNRQIFRDLLAAMTEDKRNVIRAVDLILVSRNLERIADLATNIGEEVIFIEEGKNIKHHVLDRAEDRPAAP